MLTYHQGKPIASPLFSIIIPSWNNIAFLQCCINSILKNSRFAHQIILHLNEGTDGSLDWAKAQDYCFTHSAENIGICYAVNAAAGLAQAKYVVYMNDDMYVCPDWDFYLWKEIETAASDYFFFSSTLIEPRFTKNQCVKAPYNFGDRPENFEEQKLLEFNSKLEITDWNGASWPPNIVSKKLWDMVGGYSVEFSPGMYSDPDFAMKLWQAGVRQFKGVGKSRVYHFMSKSTGKLKKTKQRKGKVIFLDKWGITANMFYSFYLKMGTKYDGELAAPTMDFRYKAKQLACKIKKLKYIFN
jgi:glycosyltransferase involved in cell wall biosynthesis